jgi:hypothetical protein
MMSLTQRRRANLFWQTPPAPVQPASVEDIFDAIEERYAAAELKDKRRRAESRAMRRYVASQPKRLVNLDAIAQPPGQPAWERMGGTFVNDLPHAFTNDWTNRYELRRA